ncbi:MAG TPA: adenylate/guanylate cyclase domain-containing protein [Actinomycetes bacterium]|nr:adenylate/guanylate cyclase domain-containing protein [Actinomycetes bacterium]
MGVSDTRYAKTVDGLHIAYQVAGDGPVDLVYLSPWFSHLEVNWELPEWSRFTQSLASFSRVILFDRRGNGLSDPVALDSSPPLEARIDDIRAVMDAVGSERAVICGASESGALGMLFAALHPERTIALISIGGSAREAWAPDYECGQPIEERQPEIALTESSWGTETYVRTMWPELAEDEALSRWMADLTRKSMSPGAALAYLKMMWDIDVRDVLPAIHVPTLILHRERDNPDAQNYLAEHIPAAQHVSLEGSEHVPYLGNQGDLTKAIERFVTKVREQESVFDRVLSTVLFTDIVDSTATMSDVGDANWRGMVERHHSTVRSLLARFRGHEVDTAGDGFFATFDGPARAVRCATSIVEAVKPIGIQVRAGIHTGEVETVAGKCAGMGVVIGARVGAQAGPSEVLTSQTVKDLTAGSGITFEDAGEHALKGVPELWHLYRVPV